MLLTTDLEAVLQERRGSLDFYLDGLRQTGEEPTPITIIYDVFREAVFDSTAGLAPDVQREFLLRAELMWKAFAGAVSEFEFASRTPRELPPSVEEKVAAVEQLCAQTLLSGGELSLDVLQKARRESEIRTGQIYNLIDTDEERGEVLARINHAWWPIEERVIRMCETSHGRSRLPFLE